jgi:epoxyqueuosine reductase
MPPRPIRDQMGTWVFGCDVCQEVCPHNHDPEPGEEDDFLPTNAWLDLDEVVVAADEALMERFRGTPIRRAKASGLKRNALIALANIGDPDAIPTAVEALNSPHPVVRAAAVWCLNKLGGSALLPSDDSSPIVRQELN